MSRFPHWMDNLKDVLQREMQDFLQDYPGDMILVTHSRDEPINSVKSFLLWTGDGSL